MVIVIFVLVIYFHSTNRGKQLFHETHTIPALYHYTVHSLQGIFKKHTSSEKWLRNENVQFERRRGDEWEGNTIHVNVFF